MSILNSNLKKLKKQDRNPKKERVFNFVLLLLCSASIFASLVMSYKLGRLDERKVWQKKEEVDNRIPVPVPYFDRGNYVPATHEYKTP